MLTSTSYGRSISSEPLLVAKCCGMKTCNIKRDYCLPHPVARICAGCVDTPVVPDQKIASCGVSW